MKQQSSYRDHDYAFGQAMLTLRSAIGLTQTALADALGVSRRTVGEWETGGKYPKHGHLKAFITLAVQQRAFRAGGEADEIRALWKAARQKVLLDEAWLAALVSVPVAAVPPPPVTPAPASEPPGREQHSYGFPFQPTNFVGRSGELAEIGRLLRDPACRLLTLIGPGGVGKTRLALAAGGQTGAYTDGVAFVALAPVGSPNQIVSTIADTLGLSFGSESDPAAHLLAWLRERHLLLVLDNFEHLLEGADLVNQILERAPRVSLLVTSRERLNLRAEWLFDVQGLAYPPVDTAGAMASLSMASVSVYSAVQLFIQRVAQVQPSYPLDEAALRTMVNICQKVVGMPLAIELAAAGARVMTLAEIDRHISSNLDVLATTLRDVPARHRSLRAVFDHSWNLLDAPERAPFSRLAVFRGGFTATAALEVAAASLPVLMRLVDKSLVRLSDAPPTQGNTGGSRFFLLEPIREYAQEKLDARGEAEALRAAHARCYLALAQSVVGEWETLSEEAALEGLDPEQDNIRAALHWAANGGDSLIGLRLVGTMVRYWRNRGYLVEGRQWLMQMLALPGSASDADDLSARLWATYGAAWIARDQHDFAIAAQLFEQSRVIRRALGESADESSSLVNAALEARATGQYGQATALFEAALADLRTTGDQGTISSGGFGYVLYFLAHTLREQGDFDNARALYIECGEFHTNIDYRPGATQGLLGLSDLARDLGDTVELRAYTDEALARYREFGTKWAIGFCLNNLALAAYLEGDLDEALAHIGESVAMFRAQKSEGSLAEVLVTLGAVLLARSDLDGAYDALTESLRLAWVRGPRLLIAAALEGMGGVLVARGDAPNAVQALGAAALLRGQMGTPLRPSDQPAYQHALEAARIALGVDAFEGAWAAAQRQPLEQVVSAVVGGE